MNSDLVIPRNYHSPLPLEETEKAILMIKEFFQINLAFELDLIRVTAPLFVKSGTGINDDLNGIERAVSFPVKAMDDTRVEVVQSLAKWKRMALADLGIGCGSGLYTDMNAIRPDEDLDNIHSLYVDQWDWERVISAEERNLEFLKRIVRTIYSVIQRTEKYVCHVHPVFEPLLPDDITFVHAEDLARRHPRLTPREREDAVCRDGRAIFIIGIGHPLSDGAPHDGRAPDYDDWSTPTAPGYYGLNGDIVVHYPVLDRAYELSSMGIRVDGGSLLRQLELRGNLDRRDLLFHRRLLDGSLPLSIGGGIGQSRLCMFCLRKAHIGEIQASVWPDEMQRTCAAHDITLL